MLSTRSKRKRRRASTESPEPSTDLLEQNKLHAQSSRNGKELFIWEGFREEYIESVEQLPLSLHRSFALLNELDTQAQVYQSGLLPTIREYVKKRQTTVERNGPFKSSNNDTEPRSGLKIRTLEETSRSREPCSPEMHAKAINALSHAQNAFEDEERCLKPVRSLPGMAMLLSDLLRASEEKVNLAQAAYDSIDRHVRLLDQAIKEHETQINTDHRTGTGSIAAGSWLRSFSTPNPRGSTRSRNDLDSTGQSPSPFKSHPARDNLHAPSSRRSRRIPAVPTRSAHTFLETSNAETNNIRHSIGQFRLGTAGDKTDAIPFRPSLTANAGPAIVLSSGDMPIDPHEPRYCYCNQVSWGEMIACDADDCEREWFHLGCAGLTEAPKGKSKWYCNACKDRMACGIRKRGH